MADNVAVTAGSGTTIAADEVSDGTLGSVKVQFVKVMDGTLDSTTKLKIAAEDAAHTTGDGGIMFLAVRKDTAAALAGTDGDYIPLIVDATGALHVAVGSIAAGTNAIGKLAANTGVDIGDVDVTSVVPGTAATNLGKAEDAGHTSGDVGVMALAVRQDTLAALAGTTADYIPLTTDALGRLNTLAGSPDTVITVTPTCDTNAYASGDLIFDSTEVAAAVRANGGTAVLQSVTITDKADQKVAFTLLIANAATDFGTLNSAPDPDDTETATVIGWVPVAATDYVDLGGASVACVRNIGLLLQAGAATTSLYVAAVNGTGTPTYGASDLVIQLGFLRS